MQVAEAIHKYARKTSITVVPRLRRRADASADPRAQPRRRRRRRHARARARSPAPADAVARRARGARPRRGRRDARHGLRRGSRDDSHGDPARTRQTALFAATMAPRIGAIAERHLRKPARDRDQGREAPDRHGAARAAVGVRRDAPQKGAALGRILEFEDPASAIVFCRTRVEVDELTETLAVTRLRRAGAARRHGAEAARPRDAMRSVRARRMSWWRPTSPRAGWTSNTSRT